MNPSLEELSRVFDDHTVDPRTRERALDFMRILARRPTTSRAVINPVKDPALCAALESKGVHPA